MRIVDFLTDATVVFFFANSLYVISYMLTSMLWLRVLAIIAAVSTFPYFYFQAEPLWSALFWQSCFLMVNLVNLLILLYSMRSTHFDEDEQLARNLKFSELKPQELRTIFRYAETVSFEEGETLMNDGSENQRLYLILEGECEVSKHGQWVATLGAGKFVGEMSFVSGDVSSADVVAGKSLRLMAWDRGELEPLFRKQGLYESYFHSLCSMDVARKLRAMTQAHTAPAPG